MIALASTLGCMSAILSSINQVCERYVVVRELPLPAKWPTWSVVPSLRPRRRNGQTLRNPSQHGIDFNAWGTQRATKIFRGPDQNSCTVAATNGVRPYHPTHYVSSTFVNLLSLADR